MRITGNRALVKPLPSLEKSPAGLLLPPVVDQMQFTVLSVGPGRKLKNSTILPPEIKPGDRILIHSFAHDQFNFDDGSKIIDAGAVLAVIE